MLSRYNPDIVTLSPKQLSQAQIAFIQNLLIYIIERVSAPSAGTLLFHNKKPGLFSSCFVWVRNTRDAVYPMAVIFLAIVYSLSQLGDFAMP
jgi:hypothetical protein